MEKELPKGWVEVTISQMVSSDGKFNDGDWVESKDQDPEGNIRLIQLADIGTNEFRDRSDRFLNIETALKLRCSFLEKGDILVARMPDPIGRACMFPLEGKNVTVVDVAFIRTGKKGANPKWLMYIINSPEIKNQIEGLASGTTRQRISRKNLDTIKFPLPPKPEQERIAAKLDSLFAEFERIKEGLAKIPVLMKNFRQAVLTQAVTGKLTEEWRVGKELEDANFLLGEIKKNRIDLYNSKIRKMSFKGGRLPKKPQVDFEFVTEQVFDIPESWKWCLIGEIGEVSNGSTPSRNVDVYWNGNIPWVSSGLVQNNKIYSTNEYVTLAGMENSSIKLLPKGTVLIAMIGEGKTRGQTSILEIEATINQNIAAVVLEHGKVLSQYLQFWFLFNYQSNRKQGNGTGPQALNCQRVRELEFVLPPFEEQQEIVRRVEALFAKADAIEARYTLLKEKIEHLPQAILSKAFRGELVEQLPTDGDAKDLLDEIKKMKAGLVEKKVKDSKSNNKISKEIKNNNLFKDSRYPLTTILAAYSKGLSEEDLLKYSKMSPHQFIIQLDIELISNKIVQTNDNNFKFNDDK